MMVGRDFWGLASGWGGGQWYFHGAIFFPFHVTNTGQWEYGGLWEVRMVDDYTGRTQAKNKSQTPLTSPGTSQLPSEVLTLIRSMFVVSKLPLQVSFKNSAKLHTGEF